jgi:hypothetical protein
VLFFYREDIFGKQQSQIIQPLKHRHKHKNENKKQKNKKHKRVVEFETKQSNDSNYSDLSYDKKSRDEQSMGSFASNHSVQSNDTFPSIGSGLSRGNNKRDDDTF